MPQAAVASKTYLRASDSRSGSDKERIESKHAHTLTAVAANTPAVADRLTLLIRNPVSAICSVR